MIELKHVSLDRRGARILSDVTLAVGEEVVALVGPSGSGKTTLLRVLLGLDAPSSGEVRIDGRVVSESRRIVVLPEERNVAMVFQDLALWPHLSVHGNLAFGLKARGVVQGERDRRIAEILSWVGLDGMADRRPGELSGGQRQRVAIARALALDPVALLLDEPLGGLDILLKDDLVDLFARLFRERRVPTLYVMHDPREAGMLAQRIVVLEDGRIVQQGSIEELTQSPRTHFAEAFARAARVAAKMSDGRHSPDFHGEVGMTRAEDGGT